jgi:hypothetical protein
MRYERAIGLNMSGLFTAEDAKLFQKTEENGIIFQKITNIGISLELVKKGLFGRFVREVKNRHSSQIIK